MKNRLLESFLALALLMAAIGWSLLCIAPPRPLAADADASLFSAGRARKHVEQIAQEIHPTGSAANRKARDYVARTFREIGLEVTIHEATERGVRVENVMAVQKGSTPGGAVVLLASHYDSTERGPGAADCAAGVAALLETARVLRQSADIKNDVLFLVTDGEERGLLGAKAFVREHQALIQRVQVALNFEARGNRGPVVMFETGKDNFELVRALGRLCAKPGACSFAQEVYKRMPNDTDFTVFRKAGLKGMNFAVVVGLDFYHTPEDTPANLDSGSLQHYGDYTVNLTRFLASAEGESLLAKDSRGDGVFFPVGPGQLACYPDRWVVPLAGFTLALALGVMAWGFLRGSLSIGPVSACASLWLLCILASGLIALGGVKAIFTFLKPNHYGTFVMNVSGTGWMLLGMLSLAFALSTLLRNWLSRRYSPANQLAGALILWLPLTLGTALKAPGGSYFFLWPAMGAALGLLFLMRWPSGSAFQRLFVLGFVLVPAAVVFGPLIYLLHHTMTIGLAPACVVPAALVFALAPFPSFQKMSAQEVSSQSEVERV